MFPSFQDGRVRGSGKHGRENRRDTRGIGSDICDVILIDHCVTTITNVIYDVKYRQNQHVFYCFIEIFQKFSALVNC